jgi:hypothetical protein
MRIAVYSFLFIAAGCAGQPSQPTPRPATRTVSNAPVVDRASLSGDKKDTSDLVVDAKRRGYTVVTENGDTLFCHKEPRPGSHFTETTCLTATQMEDMRRQTQQNLLYFQLQTPPPQGK